LNFQSIVGSWFVAADLKHDEVFISENKDAGWQT
jgi:hypothetical protein